jgi:hypothetical protein
MGGTAARPGESHCVPCQPAGRQTLKNDLRAVYLGSQAGDSHCQVAGGVSAAWSNAPIRWASERSIGGPERTWDDGILDSLRSGGKWWREVFVCRKAAKQRKQQRGRRIGGMREALCSRSGTRRSPVMQRQDTCDLKLSRQADARASRASRDENECGIAGRLFGKLPCA